MAANFKETLNLPQTNFPMRANLANREPERVAHWEQTSLYKKIQQKNADGETFILHDGPPFANGDVHIGTALNKIIKDVILHYKSMRGYRAPYIPGWDCHGLPIEHKVSQQIQKEGTEMTPAEIRRACEKFANEYIEVMRGQFTRLGVLGDWEEEYRTMDPSYEAEIVRTFAAFVEKDLVYRSKKPVYWSIPCETALSEAEIEYKDHVSPSIWVKFRIPDTSRLNVDGPVSIVIWTTTPWTLPANLAIAVHPRFEYVAVQHEGESYIVAKELAETFIEKCKLEGATIGPKFSGESLEGIEARHPFIDRTSPVVLADYVTAESGTGCVHIAPGHGLEDYLTGLKYDLEIYNPVNDQGLYADDGHIPQSLVGVSVLEQKGKNPANSAVLSLLTEAGALLQVEKYAHQYPHCWRSKTPVVFRAVDQWFVALDKDDLRKQALDAIGKVSWIPEWGENRIRGAVESRPDWCISRQRSWGVPIPVFFDEEGESYVDAGVAHAIADKIEQYGTQYWFENDAETLLDGIDLPQSWQGKQLKAGTDTLDVWIDSGSSHLASLKRHPALRWPADLYLEGSDQHRGWFQSSLWISVIREGLAPYKQVITHGFIVDQQGKKISKSNESGVKGKSKPMTSEAFVKSYGADIIRLWVCSEDYRNDITLSDEIFSHIAQSYRSIRNTLRFQISNLFDFNSAVDAIAYEDLTSLDKWALHRTYQFWKEVTAAYDKSEFQRAYQTINRFVVVTLSAIYHDVLKDRLYTLGTDSLERRSAQTAIDLIFQLLNRVLAPILVFTSDEAHAFFKENGDFTRQSIHELSWPEPPELWNGNEQALEVEKLLAVRDLVNTQLETLRQSKTIGQSLDAHVTIIGNADDDLFQLVRRHEPELPELFIVSQVSLSDTSADSSSLQVKAVKADGGRCPRCWRWVGELNETSGEEETCQRCEDAVANNLMHSES